METEISSRAELIDALRLAAELEHGLMAQYLFAAYSLKRYDYEGLAPEQLERVRRWASLITLVARQEMEHLGLALNLLSAIGGTPSFSRPNMPQPSGYYGEACTKLTLTRCDLFIIDPLRVRVTATDAADNESVLLERDDWLNPADPQMPQWEATSPMLLRRQPKRFVTNSPEAAAATGLPDPSNRSLIANRTERRRSLEALLKDIRGKKEQTKQERVAEAALETRIEQLRIVEKWWDLSEGTFNERPIDRRAYTLALQLEGWDIDVNGHVHADALGGDETRPWPLRFWMGGWDGDALCAYVRGSWEIPLL